MSKKRPHAAESATSVPTAAMSTESDADLLVQMSWRDDDEQNARTAGDEFYRRHVKYLNAVCRRVCQAKFFTEEWVDDLVQETFLKAYEQAETFNAQRVADPTEMVKVIRCWLSRIAWNLALDRCREDAENGPIHLEQLSWQEVPERAVAEEFNELAVVRDALQRVLDQREQEVLRVWFLFYDPTRENQRLPDEVVQDLAAKWKTTPENLRQIRSRAMRKIEAQLREDSAQSPADE